MVEQIEEDRKALRKKGCRGDPPRGSYIPLLSGSPKRTKKRLKLCRLSTLNILNHVDESFRIGDKHITGRLGMIRSELAGRGDLFDGVLRFLQGANVRNDLYYWLPGLSTDNVFSFTIQLIPDFISRYRSYFTRCIVIGETPLDCLHFIQERFKDAHERFKIILEDLSLFECCISHPFWSERPLVSPSPELVGLLGSPPTCVDVAEDVEGVLASELSFVECVIAGRTHTVSLLDLDGLIARDPAFKGFWTGLGVVDENWEIVEQ